MKKVFMIHGFNGEPNGGWRPWLMAELAKKDIYACALPMPNPDKPEKDEWVKTIGAAVGTPNEEIFLVGHSLGSPTILRYIESLPKGSAIGGAVLVSGPEHATGKLEYATIEHFFNTPFNFDHIKNICKNFTVIHGDNDTAVPFEHAVELAKKLACELIPIPHGGHLNGRAGWYELPQLLESLEKMFE